MIDSGKGGTIKAKKNINYEVLPYFRAVLETNRVNVTGNVANYPIVYETESRDIGNVYDETTGKFTAPVDGDYVFFCANQFYGIAADNTTCTYAIAVDTTFEIVNIFEGDIAAMRDKTTNIATLSGSKIVSMLAGQTAHVFIYIAGHVSENVSVKASTTTVRFGEFSGYLLSLR